MDSNCPNCGFRVEGLTKNQSTSVCCVECGHRFEPLQETVSMFGDEHTASFHQTGTQESDPSDHTERFGDYEILEVIAQGGMGVVFKARQISLDRIVALKKVLAGQFSRQSDIIRFQAEAEAAAQLDHPGIVPIYEVGEVEGTPFYSMGYIEGRSLANWIADSPLSVDESAVLTRKIAEAVGFAHAHGVIHRDLKPANVLIGKNGEPRVTDFGLAKRVDDEAGITQTGQVLGTPSFMPPEQAAGDAIDERADVYSIGATLYNLITGRPPFQAATPIDTLMQVRYENPVRPSRLNSSIPLDLDTICLKCLEKEPHKRYPSAVSVCEELERFELGKPIRARRIGRIENTWRWCRRNRTLASSLAIAAGLLLTLAIGGPILAVQQSNLKTQSNKALAASESALGREAAANEKLRVAIRNEKRRLAQTYQQIGMTYAEDQDPRALLQFLQAYENAPQSDPTRQSSLNLISGWGGSVASCLPCAVDGELGIGVNKAVFNPDSSLLATGGLGELSIWDMKTKRLVAILHQKQSYEIIAKARGTDWLAAFHPNENVMVTFCNRLASISHLGFDSSINFWSVPNFEKLVSIELDEVPSYVSYSNSGDYVLALVGRELVVLDSQDGELVSRCNHQAEVVAAIPDDTTNQVITVTANRVMGSQVTSVHRWDVETGEQVGEPSILPEKYIAATNGPHGLRVVTKSEAELNLWLPEDDQHQSLDIADASTATEAIFSEDGNSLIVASVGSIASFSAMDGQPIRQFGNSERIVAMISSRDGRIVAARHGNQARIWDRDTGAQIGDSIAMQAYSSAFELSPDGETLVGGFVGANAAWIWDTGVADVSQSGKAIVWNGTATHAAFSSDGFYVCVATELNGQSFTQVWNTRTSRAVSAPLALGADVSCVGFTSFGVTAVIIEDNDTIRLVDCISGHEQTSPFHHPEAWLSALSQDGSCLISCDRQEQVKLWDTANGEETGNLRFDQQVTKIGFSPSGDFAFVLKGDHGEITFWDPHDNSQIREPFLCGNRSFVAVVGNDDRTILTAPGLSLQQGGLITLWDIPTGKQIGKPLKHMGLISAISLSADNLSAFTADIDGEIRIWDTNSGHLRQRPITLQTNNIVLANPNGRQVLIGGEVGFLLNLMPIIPDDPTYVRLWVESAIGHTWDSDTQTERPLSVANWIAGFSELERNLEDSPLPLGHANNIMAEGTFARDNVYRHQPSGVAFRLPTDWEILGLQSLGRMVLGVPQVQSLGLTRQNGQDQVTVYWTKLDRTNPETIGQGEYQLLQQRFGSLVSPPQNVQHGENEGWRIKIAANEEGISGVSYVFVMPGQQGLWKIKLRATHQCPEEEIRRLLEDFVWPDS